MPRRKGELCAPGRGRPAGKRRRSKLAMPEQIPDTPENVARALLSALPKKPAEWDYLRKPGAADGKDG